jgi:hypothetical protein
MANKQIDRHHESEDVKIKLREISGKLKPSETQYISEELTQKTEVNDRKKRCHML